MTLAHVRISRQTLLKFDRLYSVFSIQVFSDACPHGIHSLLPPWHLKGHALPEPVPVGLRLLRHLGIGVERPVRKPKPRHLVSVGPVK
jgi:hypothetical protein